MSVKFLQEAGIDAGTFASVADAIEALARSVESAARGALAGEDHPAVKAALESFATRAVATVNALAPLRLDVVERGFFTHPRGDRLSTLRWGVLDLVASLNATDFDEVASKWDAAAKVKAEAEADLSAKKGTALDRLRAAFKAALKAKEARERVNYALASFSIEDALAFEDQGAAWVAETHAMAAEADKAYAAANAELAAAEAAARALMPAMDIMARYDFGREIDRARTAR